MRTIFIFVFFISCLISYAQQQHIFGAKNLGMAGASSTLGEGSSVFNNIGAVGLINKNIFFVGLNNRFGIRDLSTVGASIVVKTPFTNIGIGFVKFGSELFSRQKTRIVFSNKIEKVSLGVGIEMRQIHVSEGITTKGLSLHFGGVLELSPKVFLGSHFNNLINFLYDSNESATHPTQITTGISYRPLANITLNVDLSKEIGFQESIKVGVDYLIKDKVAIRTGVFTNPRTHTFGIGFYPKKIRLDYALASHYILGNSQEFSIAYLFGK